MGVLSKKSEVTIIGGGQVGLAEAAALLHRPNTPFKKVNIVDIDSEKIACLHRHRIYADDEYIRRILGDANGRLHATTDFGVVKDSHAVIIAVPTLINEDGSPDMKFIRAASETIAEHVTAYTLILVASTIYPDAIKEHVRPFFEARGFDIGVNLYIAHGPERINPGDNFPAYKIPRIVGGETESCTRVGYDFVKSYIDEVYQAPSADLASLVKLEENRQRLMLLTSAFECALLADQTNLDYTEAVRLAKTKPYSYQPAYPGPGLGGQCIPVDPRYLLWMARRVGLEMPMLEAAVQTLKRMTEYTISLTLRGLLREGIVIEGATILVAGNAYKENVADRTGTPAEPIIKRLEELGAKVNSFDPLTHVGTHATLEDALEGVSAVVLVTPHKVLLKEFTPELFTRHGVRVIVDARNALSTEFAVASNGALAHYGIGRQPHPHLN